MIELDGVSFVYDGAKSPCIRGASLSVGPGELVCLVGPNGSGKSTIARLACGSLLAKKGSVRVDGHDPSAGEDERRTVAQLAGLVRQDPNDQIVSSRVFDEVAFGPCNLGLEPDRVRSRVRAALEACGLSGFESRSTEGLSGGEEQRLAIAGVLAMGPAYLVLDEVTSFLDGPSRAEIRALVRTLADEGRGILEVTHEAEDLLAADRIVLVEDGRPTWEGTLADLLASGELLERSGLADDMLARMLAPLVLAGFDPADAVDPAAAAGFAREHGLEEDVLAAVGRLRPRADGVVALGMREVTVDYDGTRALEDCGLAVPSGTVTLLAGRSGSGKSTALRVLAGVLEPDEGVATLDGKTVRPGMVGLAFQRPEEQLFCDTVHEEVAFGPAHQGIRGRDLEARVRDVLRLMGIEELADCSPFQLSGGQARRVALASVIACGTSAYVFDESTAGLDGAAAAHLRSLVRALADEGAAIVVVSHDVCTWLDIADDVVLLRDGHEVWEGGTDELVGDPEAFAVSALELPLPLAIAAACARGGERA